MPRYDRYLLSQLLLIFGLFALVLVGVVWINQAVTLFDRLIADGHSALVFFEFSVLSLPNIIRIALPVATFAATIYVTHRFHNESELTVMQAIGSSPWRMARPVLAFGLIVGFMMVLLSHILLPTSLTQLKLREWEVSQYSGSRLLKEGTFLHPIQGVTFYVQSIELDGTLNDIFLSDRRQHDKTITYTALQAYLVRENQKTKLIMIDGLIQQLDSITNRLLTTSFADLSYDISDFLQRKNTNQKSLRELGTFELIYEKKQITQQYGHNLGQIVEELHDRFARSFVCLAAALIGFAALQIGTFMRFGTLPHVILAFACLIFIEIIAELCAQSVVNNPRTWLLIYLPSTWGIAIASLFLWVAAHPSLLHWRLSKRKSSA
ncbi:MAG: LPS export ABC transporter permease LptF [Aestuariivita sp.]|nr:LPS export ABC transporter permease LptF [Aestuariivita sp.]